LHRRRGLVSAGALLFAAGAALAQAPPAGAPSQPHSPPPPALADQFRAFCRDRPAGCDNNYAGQSDRFLSERATRALDEERLRLQQQQEQMRGR
jgi:hypothetical protein